MWARLDQKNEHDPSSVPISKNLTLISFLYIQHISFRPHPHVHQIPHVYTWQATQNGYQYRYIMTLVDVFAHAPILRRKAAGNTTLRDLNY